MSNPVINENNNTEQATSPPFVAATIQVANIAGGESEYIPPADASEWADYRVFHRYESDLCRYMMGVASPQGYRGSSVAFVQLHAPKVVWIVDWTACKEGAQPNVPDPFSVGSQWVLLDVHLESAMLGLKPDGQTVVWRLSGTYFFGHRNPGDGTAYSTSVFNIAQYPRAPWLDDGFTRNIPASALESALISWAGGGGQKAAGSAQGAAGGGNNLTGIVGGGNAQRVPGGGVFPGWPGG